jgi:5-methylcytosine-specific restriction endonuclease McrA
MSKSIPKSFRLVTIKRANSRCEYCRIPNIDSYYGFQVDHIISRKHEGKTILTNLAYACPDCNSYKGTDLGTYLTASLNLTRFFHPRLDKWDDHFVTDNSGFISAQTEIGEATIKIFQINHPDRIIERQLLWRLGIIS